MDEAEQDFNFVAMIPDLERGQSLRIVRTTAREMDKASKEIASSDFEHPETQDKRLADNLEQREQLLWRKDAPLAISKISALAAEPCGDELTLSWKIENDGEPGAEDMPTCSVQFSIDKGRSWNGAAVNIEGTKLALPRAHLPSGQILFRIFAHDGFDSVSATTELIELEERAPNAGILHPAENDLFLESMPMRLWANVATSNSAPINPEHCQWFVDDQHVGNGLEHWIAAPSAGDHHCSLRILGKHPISVERRFRTWTGERKRKMASSV
jgi:hypothetical protein